MRKVVSGTTTLYLVDDHNPTGYAQTVEEATVISGATNLTVTYLPGLDLVSQNRSGTVSYYGYDGNGNTRYLTSSGATISDTYLYDAFGVPLASTGSTANEFTYSGERRMPETGLTYLRARYLNSGTGRFWTKDAYGGEKTEPLSLHKYLYAQANPVNGADPSGNDYSAVSVSFGTGILITLAALTAVAVSKAKLQMQGSISFSLGGAAAEEADDFVLASASAIAAAETAVGANYSSFRNLLSKAKDEVVRLGRSITRPKVVPIPTR